MKLLISGGTVPAHHIYAIIVSPRNPPKRQIRLRVFRASNLVTRWALHALLYQKPSKGPQERIKEGDAALGVFCTSSHEHALHMILRVLVFSKCYSNKLGVAGDPLIVYRLCNLDLADLSRSRIAMAYQ